VILKPTNCIVCYQGRLLFAVGLGATLVGFFEFILPLSFTLAGVWFGLKMFLRYSAKKDREEVERMTGIEKALNGASCK